MTSKYGKKDWLNESWLDNRERQKNRIKKNVRKNEDSRLENSLCNATVIAVYPKMCRVILDTEIENKIWSEAILNSKEPVPANPFQVQGFLCHYKRAKILLKSEKGERERSPVAVGDRVKVEIQPGSSVTFREGLVVGLGERNNFLSRPSPDREETVEHVLAANIDLVCVVASAKDPDFSIGITDRFFLGCLKAGIPFILVVNKIELHSHSNPPWEIYRANGISVFEISVKNGNGIKKLEHELKGKRVLICGHSGVGKTSLLNSLMKQNIGKTAEVMLSGKGKHTTTSALLYKSAEYEIIDTPGIKEFSVTSLSVDIISQYFQEFKQLPCNQSNCNHLDEKISTCEAQNFIRYTSYQKIMNEL